MKKLIILLIVGVIFSLSAAPDALRIKHISFQPTETNKMMLYDENEQSYPFTTHKFGTIIKAAREHTNPTPKTISIQPRPAEFPEKFIISTQGKDIYFQPVGGTSYKIDSGMAWDTCRNMFGCGDYLQKGIYSSWE